MCFSYPPLRNIILFKSGFWFIPACLPPTEPENGGYRCHPSPCHFTHKMVIEYFCDEGYALKADYKFLTCQNGEWDSPMQISCRLTQGLPVKASRIILHSCTSQLMILSFFFFDHRQGAVFSAGYTGSVNSGFHSQFCGSYPAFSGALCPCTAQTQVLSPQQVRSSSAVKCWFSKQKFKLVFLVCIFLKKQNWSWCHHCLQCSFAAAGPVRNLLVSTLPSSRCFLVHNLRLACWLCTPVETWEPIPDCWQCKLR